MDKYIKTLKNKEEQFNDLSTLSTEAEDFSKYNSLKIDTTDWKTFTIGNLFNVEIDGYINTSEEDGDVPVISLSFKNNGVCMHIKETDRYTKYQGNTITCAGLVEGLKAFYQPDDYYVKDGLRICIPKFENNAYISSFICSVINMNSYLFSYGRKASGKRFLNICLKLPVLKDKNNCFIKDATCKYHKDGYIPDFNYMEDFIKSLPYSDKLRDCLN